MNPGEKASFQVIYAGETYRYYDGNTVLLFWICIPLTMGIYDREKGSVAALFSDKLWMENGLLTQSGASTT